MIDTIGKGRIRQGRVSDYIAKAHYLPVVDWSGRNLRMSLEVICEGFV